MQNRRHFLKTGISVAAAGLAGVAGARRTLAEEAPPETTSVRLESTKNDTTCLAPLDILDDLLRDEGFADVRYVIGGVSDSGAEMVTRGDVDFTQQFASSTIISIDRRRSHGHASRGASSLFRAVRSRIDPQRLTRRSEEGKTVGVADHDGRERPTINMLRVIAASVGLDPVKDINWVAFGSGAPRQLLTDDKIDAFMTYPPWAQELRARGTGHVILNSSVDRPWSQYFCCMLLGNADFIRRNPIATKRVVRAMMRATEICSAKPDWVAQRLVDRGFTPRYDYARQGLDDVSYRSWREYDAEDTVRFLRAA